MKKLTQLNYSEGIRRIFTVWCWGWGVGLFFYSLARTVEIAQSSRSFGHFVFLMDEVLVAILGTVFWAMLVPAIIAMILKWIGEGFTSKKESEA